MGMKKNSPGCNCCGPSCGNCDAITYFTLSGLGWPDCTGGCDALNGTYAFRTEGEGFPPSCTWIDSFPTYTCATSGDIDSETLRYAIGPSLGCGGTNGWGVEILNVTGGVRVTVTLTMYYTIYNSHGGSSYGYSAVFQNTFTDCASISGSLPQVSTSTTHCATYYSGLPPPFPQTDPGDLCGLYSATVSIG